jgi:hypothetical protein
MRAILLSTLLAVTLGACAVSPDAAATEPAVATTSEQSQSIDSCSSYCGFGDFYCPSNPLMECYFYCYQTCVVCDEVTTCFDNPPPQG